MHSHLIIPRFITEQKEIELRDMIHVSQCVASRLPPKQEKNVKKLYAPQQTTNKKCNISFLPLRYTAYSFRMCLSSPVLKKIA
jgi:hypothetical protein